MNLKRPGETEDTTSEGLFYTHILPSVDALSPTLTIVPSHPLRQRRTHINLPP